MAGRCCENSIDRGALFSLSADGWRPHRDRCKRAEQSLGGSEVQAGLSLGARANFGWSALRCLKGGIFASVTLT